MNNTQIELNASELEAINGGDYGGDLAKVGLGIVTATIVVALSPVTVPAAAGYGVALVVTGMAAYVYGAWMSY